MFFRSHTANTQQMYGKIGRSALEEREEADDSTRAAVTALAHSEKQMHVGVILLERGGCVDVEEQQGV